MKIIDDKRFVVEWDSMEEYFAYINYCLFIGVIKEQLLTPNWKSYTLFYFKSFPPWQQTLDKEYIKYAKEFMKIYNEII